MADHSNEINPNRLFPNPKLNFCPNACQIRVGTHPQKQNTSGVGLTKSGKKDKTCVERSILLNKNIEHTTTKRFRYKKCSGNIMLPDTSDLRSSLCQCFLTSPKPNTLVEANSISGTTGWCSKKILLFFIFLLMATPNFAKGPEESITSNNVLQGGISRVDSKHELFIQENHTNTKAQSGATAALHCALSSPLADGLVSWVRRRAHRDYHLLTVGRQVYSSDERMGVKVSPDGRDWMLTIRWVSPHDEGQYECQVSSHPPQALMVNLSVVDAHAEILGGRERYIHSGSSLRLVCLLRDATESPVYVFWYRGSRMINYDSERGVTVDNSRDASVLYVTSVTSHDEGNYTCMPSNAAPASVVVHVVKRENPAGLQQETETKTTSSSSKPSSRKSSATKKTNPEEVPSSGTNHSTYNYLITFLLIINTISSKR